MVDIDSARDLMTSAMQCTAALIAIVGGFLASRIVSLNVERTTARVQNSAAVYERDQLLNNVARMERAERESRSRRALVASIEPILSQQGQIDLRYVKRNSEDALDDLEYELTAGLNEFREAFAAAGAGVVATRPQGAGAQGSAWIQEAVRQFLKDTGTPGKSRKQALSDAADRVRDDSPETPAANLPRDDIERKLDLLASEIRETGAQIESLVRPSGLTSGLTILGYLAVVGLALPSMVLARGIDSAQPWVVPGTTALFLSGVLALVAYLWSIGSRA